MIIDNPYIALRNPENSLKMKYLSPILLLFVLVSFTSCDDFNKTESKRILYVLAHTGDEVIGPAALINNQTNYKQESYLLYLTTDNLTPTLRRVSQIVGSQNLKCFPFANGRLRDYSREQIADSIAIIIESFRPDVVVTFPLDGVNGKSDHHITHLSVKKAIEKFDSTKYKPKRLAFLSYVASQNLPNIFITPNKKIDAEISLGAGALEASDHVWKVYGDSLPEWTIFSPSPNKIHLSFFNERHVPSLTQLTEKLPSK